MSITPEMIDAMMAAGLSREQMAVLMKAGLADAEREKSERKARAAAKKRRQRAEVALEPFDVPETLGDNKRQTGTIGDTEGQAGTSGDEATDVAKNGPQTPKETTPSEITPSDPKGSSVPCGTDRRRGTRIPDGFEQSPEARQVAADFGFIGSAADEALAEFGDYWRPLPGLKATKLDWVGTLRNRLREVVRRRPPPGRPPPGERISGLTALARDKALARATGVRDVPSLDLQPASAPFPSRDGVRARDLEGSEGEARRDEERPFGAAAGTVHDFPVRRAVG